MKIADSYINLLSSFSDEIKLRVIRKLSESLLRGKKKETSIPQIMAILNGIHMVNMVNTGMITNGILTAV